MIKDENITKYTLYDKIYVPTQYYDEDFKYTINNDTLTIITDQNCTTNYNTTNCTCYQLNLKYNILTNQYSCNRNPNYEIDHYYITTDINYSDRINTKFTQDYTILYGIIIIAIIFSLLMKRNSRNL